MLTLYDCQRSRGLRALWTIEEMELNCELRMMPFPPRARVPAYKDLNPVGTVPTFVDGATILTESCAIVHYLVTRFGPSDLAVAPGEQDYGEFLDYLYYADATLTFPLTVYLRFNVMEAARGLQEAGKAYVDFYSGRLPKIERRLADREYLCANRFTAADIAVGYGLFLSTLIGLEHLLNPTVKAYLERLISRPGFVRATEREARELKLQNAQSSPKESLMPSATSAARSG